MLMAMRRDESRALGERVSPSDAVLCAVVRDGPEVHAASVPLR